MMHKDLNKIIHQNYCFEQNENYLTGVLLRGIHGKNEHNYLINSDFI